MVVFKVFLGICILIDVYFFISYFDNMLGKVFIFFGSWVICFFVLCIILIDDILMIGGLLGLGLLNWCMLYIVFVSIMYIFGLRRSECLNLMVVGLIVLFRLGVGLLKL